MRDVGQETCSRCHLCRTARNVKVESRGSPSPIVLFVGEAPGQQEDRKNTTFIGKSGEKLAEVLQRVGIPEDYCRWTNVVRCIPWADANKQGVRVPTDVEIIACCDYLDQEILALKPSIIIPLGGTAIKYFTGIQGIGKQRGRKITVKVPTTLNRYHRMMSWTKARGIQDGKLSVKTYPAMENAIKKAVDKHGYVDLSTEDFPLFPSWHPAYIIRGNYDAETDMLVDFNYVSAWIHGKDQQGEYVILKTVDEVASVVDQMITDYREGKCKYVSFDLETGDKDPALGALNPWAPGGMITTIAITTEREKGYAIPFEHHESPFGDYMELTAIKSLLNRLFAEVPVVGQNVKFDIRWCHVKGIEVPRVYDDTELMSWTLLNDTSKHDLETLVSRYTDFLLHKQEMRDAQDVIPRGMHKWNTNNYPLDIIAKYNAADVDATLRLHRVFEESLIREGLKKPHEEITVPAIPVTIAMELNGNKIDLDYLAELEVDFAERLDDYRRTVDKLGLADVVEDLVEQMGGKRRAFNLNSTDHKALLLFNALGLEPKRFGKRREVGIFKGRKVGSTAKDVLVELEEDVNEELGYETNPARRDQLKAVIQTIDVLRNYGKLSRLQSGYVRSLPKRADSSGLVHSDYGVRRTSTGRYSCVSGNTLLDTSRGVFAIGDYEQQPGDTILTHLGRHCPIIRKIVKGVDRMYRVTVSSGHGVECTKDHRLLTPIGWRYLRDLSVGQEVYCVDMPATYKGSGHCGQGAPVVRGGQDQANDPAGCGCCRSDASHSDGDLDCAPSRRESAKQRVGQPGRVYARGPREVTPEIGRITEITPLGPMAVFDIEVAEDHSYWAHGLCHHNSRSPNLQNLPRGENPIKNAFISRWDDGVILAADYSQNELRMLAMETGDKELMQAFFDGVDIHTMITARVMGCAEDEVLKSDRSRIKTVVFGLLYGRGAKAIAAQERITVEEAQELIDYVLDRFPAVRKYMKRQIAFVKQNMYVKTLMGFRRIIFPDPEDEGAQGRKSYNTPIQSAASDLGVVAMTNIHKRVQKLGMQSKQNQFVHDSIGFDVYPGELTKLMVLMHKEMVERLPQRFAFINVPLKADFDLGVTWGQSLGCEYDRKTKLMVVTGKKTNYNLLMEKLLRWENPPTRGSITVLNKETKEIRAVVDWSKTAT